MAASSYRKDRLSYAAAFVPTARLTNSSPKSTEDRVGYVYCPVPQRLSKLPTGAVG